jgi:acetyltransferase-like isoleucine patch superfamily enzyme
MCYGGSIEIGRRVLIGRQVTMFGHGGIRIGADSMIGPTCTIVSSNHVATLEGRSFQDQGFTREEVSIGENVWIGANCVVLPGTVIERSVVVAAGSVAVGELKSGAIYRGNPAERVKPLLPNMDELRDIEFRDWGWL